MSKTYRNDKLYIEDIIESIGAIESYLDGLEYQTFIENRMVYAATIRELEIIGEAVGKISQTIKEKYTEIDYRTIKDFRNVLAHEYFGVDMEIVWMIATDKIPELKQHIQRIKI
jgi:uncharacterized protein with HEPN domain